MKPFPDFSADDFAKAKQGGYAAFMEKTMADVSRFYAQSLDRAIRDFVNGIEGRDVPLHEVGIGGQIVKLKTAAQDSPDEFESFFIWKGRALGYRYLSATHANDKSQAMTLDYTFQFTEVSRDQWPQALASFIEGESHG